MSVLSFSVVYLCPCILRPSACFCRRRDGVFRWPVDRQPSCLHRARQLQQHSHQRLRYVKPCSSACRWFVVGLGQVFTLHLQENYKFKK